MIPLKLVPRHVAIIPDGNRRWAARLQQDAPFGHQKGCDIILDIVEAASDIDIEYMTLYIFSTENWKRSKMEIDALMGLLKLYLQRETPRMIEKGVKLNTIGVLDPLPEDVKQTIKESKEKTAHCSKIHLILALNYGGRSEICRSFSKICSKIEKGTLKKEDVTEETVSRHLDTSRWPDPDLLIRTSGEMRISNYLLWQLSYSEFYYTETLWPDFTPDRFYAAIDDYKQRERRLGGS